VDVNKYQHSSKPSTLAASNLNTLLMRDLLYLLFIPFIYSCHQTTNNSNNLIPKDPTSISKPVSDTYPRMKIWTQREIYSNQMEIKKYERFDSIRLAKALSKALSYAAQNKSKQSLTYSFEMLSPDSSFNSTTSVFYGDLFTKGKKHLFIRQQGLLDIFLLQEDRFKLVCEHKQDAMTYINDTLKDVNGDNYKDFLVHWYPSSGCCRRDVYNVFLYLPTTGGFTSDYEFINPTFSAKEKIIRGVQYGHPGEVALYKYKWRNLMVDTLEFVIPKDINRKQFYVTQKSDWHRPPIVKSKLVDKIPKEYENIESIEWFLYE